MKNVSRNKFLLCFKPVVDMDFVLDSNAAAHGFRDKAFTTYLAVESRADMKFSLTKSFVSEDGCSNNSESSMIQRAPRRKAFSQVIKAVLFESILAKRVRDRRGDGHQNSYGSKSCSFSVNYRRESMPPSDDKSKNLASLDEIQGIKSSSLLSSVTSFSSSSPSCSPEPRRQKLRQEHEVEARREHASCYDNHSSFNSSVYLLLISLTMTILWGKICAILLTSIWLYFMPHHNSSNQRYEPEDKPTPLERESGNYKKRVIMEGLLRRSQRQGSIKSST